MSFHSERVVGEMYDKVDRVNFKPEYRESFDSRILMAFGSDFLNDVLEAIRQLKQEYDEDIRRVMD